MKVQLTYFRANGSYYARGEYKTKKGFLSEIYDEINKMFKQNKRPGLLDGHSNFHVLIEVIGFSQDPYLMLNAA